MKKYFAAAAVAVMVFAFAAFAATLNVNAGSLQAGEAVDLDCLEEANVAAWGYHDAPGDVETRYATIDLVGNGCADGEHMHVILLDSNQEELARATNSPQLIAGVGDEKIQFDFADVHPKDVDGIRIGVDQGHSDYEY